MVHAQGLQPISTLQNFRFYGSQDGFYADKISAIEQDNLGFLWLGTSEGLIKYDGQKFISFDIEKAGSRRLNSFIDYILKEKSGDFWVATSTGVVHYNQEDGRFTDLQLPGGEEADASHLAQDSKGNLWIGSLKGIYIHDTSGKTWWLHPKHINRMSSLVIADDSAHVWAIMHDYIYKYDANSYALLDSIRYSDQKMVNDNVPKSGFLDAFGNLWWGKYNGEVYKYSTKTRSLQMIPCQSICGKKQAIINKMFTKDNKNIWFCIDEAGVFQYNHETGTFKPFISRGTTAKRIPCYKITSFFIDRENNYWAGMEKNGLAMSNSQLNIFGTILVHSHSKSTIVSIPYKDSKKNLWIGTDGGGLHLYNDSMHYVRSFVHQPNRADGLQDDAILTVFEDSKKRVWVGSFRGGLSRYQPATQTFKNYLHIPGNPNSLLKNDVRKITEDKEGNLWLAVHGRGVSCFNPEKEQFTHYTEMGSPWTFDLLIDSEETIWAATVSGIVRKKKGEKSFTSFLTNPFAETLPDNRINCLHEYPKGRIWMGTVHGLFYTDKQVSKPIEVKLFPNLRRSSVRSVSHDGKGNIYVTTNRGLFRLDPTMGHCIQYGIEEGVCSEDFIINSAQFYQRSTFFFGTSKGVCYLQPDDIQLKDVPFTPSISDIRIFDKSILPGSENALLNKLAQYLRSLSLSYKQNHVAFEFACPIYSHGSKNLQFQYQLEGFDHAWQQCSNNRNAIYSNLPPGEYVLKIRVIKDDYIPSKITMLPVVVTPPYWETWVFRILFLVGMSGLLIGFYFWRTRSIRKHNMELHAEVDRQTMSLQLVNEEVTHLYNGLTESIEAAQVIQTAILPGKNVLEASFETIEVFYRPKDVVSGDFYWCENQHDRYYLAAGDCTGHGVAGAFMTFIGYESLNQVFKESAGAAPGEFLSILNHTIISSLTRYQSGGVQAGMDFALCAYDKKTGILEFAGANLPLYLVRDGSLLSFKGDRQGIGGKQRQVNYQFRTHYIQVQKGDQVYLFTDGFADQVGGKSGEEKFMYPRFREALISVSSMSVSDRISFLEKTFDVWRNGQEQLDDVLVISFDIS